MKRTAFPSRFVNALSLVPAMVLLLPATQAAVVYTTVLSGDPNQPDTDVMFGVGVRDNAEAMVSSYAFLLRWPPSMLAVQVIHDASFGKNPDTRTRDGQLLIAQFLPVRTDHKEVLLAKVTMRTTADVLSHSYSLTA